MNGAGQQSSGGRLAFLALYASSGAAALVYEVAWTRLLTLQLGHTVAAASTVLAAFMGGLAIGAWVAGASAESTGITPGSSHALRAYAALEMFVAVAAIVLPLALHATVPLLAWAYADGDAPTRFAVVRVAISLLIVGVPATAMGATFPIAAAWMTRTVDAGPLYAANTAGATLGAIAAGFWLIPALGIRSTTWVGVALNVIAASGAIWLASRTTTPRTSTPRPRRAGSVRTQSTSGPRQPAESPPSTAWIGVAAVAVSGLAALVYEVAWTRLLAMVIGPTTYAFATMAAAFISGLAIGSAAGSRVARQSTRPAAWVAALLVAGSLASVLAAWFASARMPLVVATEVVEPSATLASVAFEQAGLVALVLLPLTIALGATFPLALACVDTDANVPRATARIYTSNTLGAITGALAAGFALVPWLGLEATIRWTAIATAVAGAILYTASLRLRTQHSKLKTQPWYLVASAATLAAIALVPHWDHALLASGAYKYAPYLNRAGVRGGLDTADIDDALRAGTLEYYKEGAAGTVSVRSLTGTRSLSIDGKVDASDGGDMLTQRLLGLLPVLVHGHARNICIIGLGSGVTLGSALAHPGVERADVLEISPEVVEASHLFEHENGGALGRKGIRLVVGDGRSHLLLASTKYDVIVSEPSNPWMAGVAVLFTREFFEAARARLEPDGLMCQWAHAYDISPADLQSIVRTFASVFPQTTLWLIGDGDLLLIGARGGSITNRLASLASATPGAAETAALAGVGIAPGTAPFVLLSLYAGGPSEVERYSSGALIQTDDRTALEYSAPRGIYGRTTGDNAATLRALAPAADKPPILQAAITQARDTDWASRGMMEMKAQAFGPAYDAYKRAVQLNSRNLSALAGLSDAAGGAGRLDDEREWLEKTVAQEGDNVPLRLELSRVFAVTGNRQASIDAATMAVRLAPDSPRAAEQLASVLADAGDAERLAPLADTMIRRFPDRIDPVFYRATALYLRGHAEEAVRELREVVARKPDHARAQNLLGAACAALGNRDCAQSAFDASIFANPRDPNGYINAGLMSLQSANPAVAARYFASATVIDPSSSAAHDGLARARAALGR